ncbi:MAG TPA: PLP-dependent aminotransferase family protein [Pyrinomonadaceae bacterium]|jgi:DNA-binding transcriptional MocR family regulator|nr:PLP-dependent aminotransferase family protein [Pyrinomonadaceae bacterium]
MWSPELSGQVGAKSQAIVSALSQDIESGQLKAGTRLPTHRELADKLGVAIGTVTRAYALAQRRGLISGEVGRGTFVGASGVAAARAETVAEPAIVDLSRNLLIRDAREVKLVETLASIRDQTEFGQLLDCYQTAAGAERHRRAAAAWIGRAGFPVSFAQTLICSGAQHATSVALATLLEPGDTLLTEHVTYPGIKALATLLRLQLRGLPVDSAGLQPEAFEAACRAGRVKALYCVPTLHNPTASIMPEDRRREIARIAREYDVVIIEDDVYGFLPHDAPLPIAAHAPEQTYYITSTSKSIAPGLRIGYMVAPAEAFERLSTTIRTTTWEAAPLMAELVTKWIEDGTADATVRWKRSETQARQSLATGILGDFYEAPPHVSCHIWLQLPEPWRSADFAAQAQKRGVIVTPSEAFVVGRGASPHAVRVCLGSPRRRLQLERGLQILSELLQSSPEPALTVT